MWWFFVIFSATEEGSTDIIVGCLQQPAQQGFPFGNYTCPTTIVKTRRSHSFSQEYVNNNLEETKTTTPGTSKNRSCGYLIFARM
jgi:hypothetical protein